jgi:hypothetical protein
MSRRCPCGARHDDDAFRALPIVDVLDEAALGALVLRWPTGTIVDVRACDACGRPIARLSPPAEDRFGVRFA